MPRSAHGRPQPSPPLERLPTDARLHGLGNGLINVVLLLAILVGSRVIHEFGHFIVARRAGVRSTSSASASRPARYVLPRQEGHRLHAQLAAHRWLRAHGRGGGRIGRSELLRPAGPGPPAGDPARRRDHEHPARLRHLHGIALLPTRSPVATSARSRPTHRPQPIGLQGGQQTGTDPNGIHPMYDDTGDQILAIDGQRFLIFDSLGSRLPPSPTCVHAGQPVTLDRPSRRRQWSACPGHAAAT